MSQQFSTGFKSGLADYHHLVVTPTWRRKFTTSRTRGGANIVIHQHSLGYIQFGRQLCDGHTSWSELRGGVCGVPQLPPDGIGGGLSHPLSQCGDVTVLPYFADFGLPDHFCPRLLESPEKAAAALK